MSARHEYHPEETRKKISHPIIDGDGHWIEYTPVFAERMRKVVGDKGADGFIASQRRIPDALSQTIEQRKARGAAMEGYWGRQSTNTRDRATAMMPKMLYDRLDELGIDFGIVYPTAGLGIPRIADTETRRAVIRGFNIVTAEYFAKLSDRLTPAAVIPMHTPEEAIEELEFVTKQLGAKVGMFGSSVARPLEIAKGPASKGVDPQVARHAVFYDQFGLDSDYDYDPVWRKCVELGVAPTFHTGGRGFGLLEGGVGWGCQLFADLIEHWERRGKAGLEYMHPSKLDRPLLRQLVEKYGYDEMAAELQKRDGWPQKEEDELTGGVAAFDDYAACEITKKQDWTDLFVTPFFFGCEADDRMNAVAFSNFNPFGAKINAIYSSDIGHFVVPDMRMVLPEAYELVEHGFITKDDFRDFTFENAVRLWGTVNPRFFDGTRVAKEAKAVLGSTPARAAAE